MHANLKRGDGTPVGAVYGFMNMLFPLLTASAAGDEWICVFDAARINWRNEIYPNYKQNRTDPPADLVVQFPIIRAAVKSLGMPVLDIPGVEADDVIATLVMQQCNAGQTRIITGDKDLMQLVSPCCFLYDGMKNAEIREPGVLEKFGVRPDQVADVQAIMGDSTDNIPGVRGLGPKGAAELINEFGTLENLYANLDAVKKDRTRELLRQYRDDAFVSQKLAQLKTDCELPEFYRGPFVFDTDAALRFARNELESNSLVAKIEKLFPAALRPPIRHGKGDWTVIKSLSQLDEFLSGARDVLAIDTETTGLNQMTARMVGISLATDGDRGVYIPLRHNAGTELFGNAENPNLDIAAVYARLRPLFINPRIKKVGHNLKYDFHIMENEGWDVAEIEPYDDTMLMSYVLDGARHGHGLDELARIHLGHENISFDSLFPPRAKDSDKNFADVAIATAGKYAAEDSYICFALHEFFNLQMDAAARKVYEELDQPLVKILMRMERAGISVNQAQLKNLSEVFHTRLNAAAAEIFKIIGREFNIASPKQLGEVLYDELKLPTDKSRSTDIETLKKLSHPVIAKILQWRSLAKLAGTYADALPRQIGGDGRIHTTYLQTSTNTGRLSSRDPNLQNIPLKTELGREIRACFVAAPGKSLLSIDYSQIQLRLLADMAVEPALKTAFANGADIHAATAQRIFGMLTPETRRMAKTINFSIIYGISAFGLAPQLGVSNAEAQNIINSYMDGLPAIKDFIERTKKTAIKDGFVITPMGRKIYFPGMESPRLRAGLLRAAVNAPIQGAEADIVRCAMIEIDRYLAGRNDAKMLLQIHDEVVLECDAAAAETVAVDVREIMENAVKLSIPIKCDYTLSDNLGK